MDVDIETNEDTCDVNDDVINLGEEQYATHNNTSITQVEDPHLSVRNYTDLPIGCSVFEKNALLLNVPYNKDKRRDLYKKTVKYMLDRSPITARLNEEIVKRPSTLLFRQQHVKRTNYLDNPVELVNQFKTVFDSSMNWYRDKTKVSLKNTAKRKFCENTSSDANLLASSLAFNSHIALYLLNSFNALSVQIPKHINTFNVVYNLKAIGICTYGNLREEILTITKYMPKVIVSIAPSKMITAETINEEIKSTYYEAFKTNFAYDFSSTRLLCYQCVQKKINRVAAPESRRNFSKFELFLKLQPETWQAIKTSKTFPHYLYNTNEAVKTAYDKYIEVLLKDKSLSMDLIEDFLQDASHLHSKKMKRYFYCNYCNNELDVICRDSKGKIFDYKNDINYIKHVFLCCIKRQWIIHDNNTISIDTNSIYQNQLSAFIANLRASHRVLPTNIQEYSELEPSRIESSAQVFTLPRTRLDIHWKRLSLNASDTTIYLPKPFNTTNTPNPQQGEFSQFMDLNVNDSVSPKIQDTDVLLTSSLDPLVLERLSKKPVSPASSTPADQKSKDKDVSVAPASLTPADRKIYEIYDAPFNCENCFIRPTSKCKKSMSHLYDVESDSDDDDVDSQKDSEKKPIHEPIGWLNSFYPETVDFFVKLIPQAEKYLLTNAGILREFEDNKLAFMETVFYNLKERYPIDLFDKISNLEPIYLYTCMLLNAHDAYRHFNGASGDSNPLHFQYLYRVATGTRFERYICDAELEYRHIFLHVNLENANAYNNLITLQRRGQLLIFPTTCLCHGIFALQMQKAIHKMMTRSRINPHAIINALLLYYKNTDLHIANSVHIHRHCVVAFINLKNKRRIIDGETYDTSLYEHHCEPIHYDMEKYPTLYSFITDTVKKNTTTQEVGTDANVVEDSEFTPSYKIKLPCANIDTSAHFLQCLGYVSNVSSRLSSANNRLHKEMFTYVLKKLGDLFAISNRELKFKNSFEGTDFLIQRRVYEGPFIDEEVDYNTDKQYMDDMIKIFKPHNEVDIWRDCASADFDIKPSYNVPSTSNDDALHQGKYDTTLDYIFDTDIPIEYIPQNHAFKQYTLYIMRQLILALYNLHGHFHIAKQLPYHYQKISPIFANSKDYIKTWLDYAHRGKKQYHALSKLLYENNIDFNSIPFKAMILYYSNRNIYHHTFFLSPRFLLCKTIKEIEALSCKFNLGGNIERMKFSDFGSPTIHTRADIFTRVRKLCYFEFNALSNIFGTIYICYFSNGTYFSANMCDINHYNRRYTLFNVIENQIINDKLPLQVQQELADARALCDIIIDRNK